MSTNSSSSTKSRSDAGRLVRVKCSFCGNIFYSVPRDAVCRKCNRPANRPLPLGLRAASLLVPVFGLIYSAVIRSHSPVASNHGLLASLVGLALYGLAYGLLHLH